MTVVDASAIIEVLLRTPTSKALEERLFRAGETLHAPHLIDVEVAQVLRRYERGGEMTAARCRDAISDLSDMPLIRYPHDFLMHRIWELRNNLTAYDAAYVALAEALDARSLTCDRRLARAAGHHARIELV